MDPICSLGNISATVKGTHVCDGSKKATKVLKESKNVFEKKTTKSLQKKLYWPFLVEEMAKTNVFFLIFYRNRFRIVQNVF